MLGTWYHLVHYLYRNQCVFIVGCEYDRLTQLLEHAHRARLFYVMYDTSL